MPTKKKIKKTIKSTNNLSLSRAANVNPVEGINLPPEKIKEILLGATVKEGIQLLPFFGKVFQVVKNIDQEFKQAQLIILLREFKDHFESIDEAQRKLENLLTSKAGMILFKKLIHVLDNSDLDEEWLSLLGRVLYSISDSDFKKQFDKHSYTLSQIEQLSAQGLLLISQFNIWSKIKFTGSTTVSKQTLVGDRHNQLARFFCKETGITDGDVIERVKHAFNDLESKGIFYLTEGKSVLLTHVGGEILSYIDR